MLKREQERLLCQLRRAGLPPSNLKRERNKYSSHRSCSPLEPHGGAPVRVNADGGAPASAEHAARTPAAPIPHPVESSLRGYRLIKLKSE